MLPDTLGHVFDVPLRLAPSSVAVIQGDTTLTYRELDALVQPRGERADAGSACARAHRVALMFSNDWRFLPAFLGPMRIGAVSVPAEHPDGGRGARLRGRRTPRRRCWWRAATRRSAPGASRARSRGWPTSWWTRRPPTARSSGTRGSRPRPRASGAAASTPTRCACSPTPPGSTGKPKGVLLAHRGQVWNADIIRKMACLDDTERALVAVPLYHKNAMIGAVKPFLLAGGSLVILPGFDPVEVIRAIDRHKVTYLTGVPGHVQADARREGHPRAAQRPLDPLRALRLGRGAGGAPGRVPAGLRGADRRVVRADRGRAGADGEPALRAQEARLLRRRRRRLPEPHRLDGRRGHRLRRRRGRRARHAEPRSRQGVLEAPRGDGPEDPGRLALHRRPDAPGPGRLLLLRRAARTT